MVSGFCGIPLLKLKEQARPQIPFESQPFMGKPCKEGPGYIFGPVSLTKITKAIARSQRPLWVGIAGLNYLATILRVVCERTIKVRY